MRVAIHLILPPFLFFFHSLYIFLSLSFSGNVFDFRVHSVVVDVAFIQFRNQIRNWFRRQFLVRCVLIPDRSIQDDREKSKCTESLAIEFLLWNNFLFLLSVEHFSCLQWFLFFACEKQRNRKEKKIIEVKMLNNSGECRKIKWLKHTHTLTLIHWHSHVLNSCFVYLFGRR